MMRRIFALTLAILLLSSNACFAGYQLIVWDNTNKKVVAIADGSNGQVPVTNGSESIVWGAGMSWPSAGIPQSTGSAWGTSLTFSTSTSLGSSDTTISSQNAVKTYTDTKLSKTTAGEIAAMTLKSVPTKDDLILIEDAADSNAKKYVTNGTLGRVVQMAYTETGAYASGSTPMPNDDTIPQITEGTEFMTVTITPKSASNILKIDVTWNGIGGNDALVVALFRDSTSNALAAVTNGEGYSVDCYTTNFSHFMVAGTTSSITFRVRAGSASATDYFNGQGGARKLGGVMASSIVVTEYLPAS